MPPSDTEAAVKRSRGRPKKQPDAVAPAAPAIAKRRGRPPAAAAAAAVPAIAKRRGRPPSGIPSRVNTARAGHRGRPRIYAVDYVKVERTALLLTASERHTLGVKLLASVQAQ
jgi:hypothetical protein